MRTEMTMPVSGDEPLERAAWRLLEETKVLDQLRRVGEPKVHGSPKLGTMAWAEIDIYVGIAKPTMVDVCTVLTGLATRVAIRDVHVINQVDFPKRYATGGIMIIDIGIEWEQAERKLKQRAVQSPWYLRNRAYTERGNYFYSNDIYRAVLAGKASTYDEFRDLLKATRSLALP